MKKKSKIEQGVLAICVMLFGIWSNVFIWCQLGKPDWALLPCTVGALIIVMSAFGWLMSSMEP